jgi:hypothetical protein
MSIDLFFRHLNHQRPAFEADALEGLINSLLTMRNLFRFYRIDIPICILLQCLFIVSGFIIFKLKFQPYSQTNWMVYVGCSLKINFNFIRHFWKKSKTNINNHLFFHVLWSNSNSATTTGPITPQLLQQTYIKISKNIFNYKFHIVVYNVI